MRFGLMFLMSFLLAFQVAQGQQGSDLITVKLNPQKGEGPFLMGFSRINPNVKGENVFQSGYPDPLIYDGEMEGFEEYLLIPNSIQYTYLNFKKGLTDDSSWKSIISMYGENAAAVKEVTDNDHRFFIRLAVKEIGDSAMQIWVDQNGDDVWQADEIYQYEKNPADTWETGIARFPNIQVQYEDMVNGVLEKVKLEVQLVPFMSPGNILYAYKNHYQGILDDGVGNQVVIFLSNSFTSSYFDNNNLKAFVAEMDEDWTSVNAFQREFFEFGEAIQLGEEKYLIHGVDKWGSELTLRKLGENEEWIGTQKGAKAPAIVSKTLKDEAYDIDNGKITMLDFWGSWCGPCVGEIPLLKDVAAFFEGDQFELVGMVYDQRGTVEKFIENNGVNWKQVMHTYEGDELDYAKVYNINAYPTTFLIGDDGKVLVKNDGLRGFQLYKTLCQHLGIAEETFLDHIASGEATLVFEVSDPKISNIYLTGGKFDKQKYYAYKSGNHFVRGYTWENGEVEEVLQVTFMLNGKQETKDIHLAKDLIADGKIVISL
ncbi:TlpA disulfide reductase family protein [Cecembia sp.]|uniref:TlpA family protein disulfide reductase n=1 Tax=Cecembia sp. TaxID=1898110 RepID=UPI0025C27413|nr:TlpA disulfide reductase family protein [Cecembia sp.]